MAPDTHRPRFVIIPNRAEIIVSGEDSFDFLQSLITQDVHLLDSQPMIHACLLSAQGKFLHDFLITKNETHFNLECANDEVDELLKRLTLYRLRKKITLSHNYNIARFILLDSPTPSSVKDPRHDKLGWRDNHQPTDMIDVSYDVFDQRRITLGVADGRRDAIVNKSTLAELNLTKTSVSYTKGCYVGQELTARMHHRALNKKLLTQVIFPQAYTPQFGDSVMIDNSECGDVRSHNGFIGLCVLKNNVINQFPRTKLGFVDFSNYDNVTFVNRAGE